MNVVLVERPEGNYYEIVVWRGLYSGANYKLEVKRDCYNSICITFYEYNPLGEHGGDYVGSDKGHHTSGNFKTLDIWDVAIAKELAEAILELSKPEYTLAEPID